MAMFPGRQNPSAVVIKHHSDVPAGSVGYFSRAEQEPIDARKDGNGAWFEARTNKPLTPKKKWVFTSHSGPANLAAMRTLVHDELLQEAVGFTDEQANTVLGALHDKLAETEHYLGSYRDDRTPKPEDLCCDYHRLRFEDGTRQYESLRGREKGLQQLIEVFTRYAHSLGQSATHPHAVEQRDLEAIADQIVWNENDTSQITEQQLIELLRQATMLGR